MSSVNKTYIFKVKLKQDKQIYRNIELMGSQTLDDLHLEILNTLGFDQDHLYSFFMDNMAWSREKEYCSPLCSKGEYADKVRMYNLLFSVKQNFLYLYDYGDEWQFQVEFLGYGIKDDKKKYPRVLKKVGKSPEQYNITDD